MKGTPGSVGEAFEAEVLSVGYPGSESLALDRVQMSVGRGLFYAILGPNGSGKSTLMRALLGVLSPSHGAARVEGKDARSWHRAELARVVGAVAQSETVTFPMTARDLVAMGRYPYLGAFGRERDEDRQAIDSAMERCDVVELQNRELGTLSGGEAQRVRIARALAQSPRSLALDEPTSSLDIHHEMAILELLRRSVDGGTTLLLVTHHLELAGRFADRVLLLDQGRVAAEGPPREVLTGEILSRVYRWPVVVESSESDGFPRITPARSPGQGSDARASS